MLKIQKKIILIQYLIISFCLITGCKGFQPDDRYNIISTISGTAGKNILSNLKIDKNRSFTLYFRPEKNTDYINIEMRSVITVNGVYKRKRTIKTFFVVEKAIDISKFRKKKSGIYTEIGRNFDIKWNRQQNITLHTSNDDPLEKIEKTSLYRIRFTTFNHEYIKLEYSLKIKSDCRIIFSEKI